MGTRTWTRKGVLTAAGRRRLAGGAGGTVGTVSLDRTLNNQQNAGELSRLIDEAGSQQFDGAYRERDTNVSYNENDEYQETLDYIKTAMRPDGTWDAKKLKSLIEQNERSPFEDDINPRFSGARDAVKSLMAELKDVVDAAESDTSEGKAASVNTGVIDFLNEIGRESGAPGFFDRLLRGEQAQTPAAIAETQKLTDNMGKIADYMGRMSTAIQPDLIPPAQGDNVIRNVLSRALNYAARNQQEQKILDDLGLLSVRLDGQNLTRQHNRVVQGLGQLAQLHNDVARSLARGTNAGITDAINRTADVTTGARTAVDTVLYGANRQMRIVRQLRDLARVAANPGTPEMLRAAILDTIKAVPYRQQEKASRGAVKALARIGRTGALSSLMSVASQRNLGNTGDVKANVTEMRQGLERATQLASQKGSLSDEIDALIRPIQRASAVRRSGL